MLVDYHRIGKFLIPSDARFIADYYLRHLGEPWGRGAQLKHLAAFFLPYLLWNIFKGSGSDHENEKQGAEGLFEFAIAEAIEQAEELIRQQPHWRSTPFQPLIIWPYANAALRRLKIIFFDSN